MSKKQLWKNTAKPLVQGAFLSEEWAEMLTKRIGSGRSKNDRELLRLILKQQDIEIDSFIQSDGSKLLETINQKVAPKRNSIAHSGEHASQSDSKISIECAEILLSGVVKK